jgi:orotidine-5'-phosphate decarboxylase
MREKNKLLENRSFEIVHEPRPGEFLRCIIDRRQFSGVSPFRIGPRRRHAEIRFEQDEVELCVQSYRLHDFPAAATNGSGTNEKKRNVGAELRGQFQQLGLLQANREKFIQAEQCAGGIAAPPTQSCAVRNFLSQRDRYPAREISSLAEKFRGAHHEIVVAGWQGRIVAGKTNLAVVPRPFDRDSVCKRDRCHQRLDFVESVGAPAFDPKGKIDFRRRPKLHILQFVHQEPQNNRMKSPLAEKIIVALDVATRKEALKLMSLLSGAVGVFKIGLQRYTADGPALLRAAHFLGPVFLDLKLHDIPNTVAKAVESADKLGVKMLTLHLSGGSEMVRAAVAARKSGMWLLGVTVLTSSSDETLKEIGVSETTREQVLRLARLGVANGIDGLVASPHEARMLRDEFGDKIKIVTPGIRPAGTEAGDQKRFTTPREAIEAGADYLVIGRPITAALDPSAAVERIVAEFAA